MHARNRGVWNQDPAFVAERNKKAIEWAPLVWKIAINFWKRGAGKSLGSVEDCFQFGMIGVMRAVELYEPGRAKFVTYAYKAAWSSMIGQIRRRCHWPAVSPEFLGFDSGRNGLAGTTHWEQLVAASRPEPVDQVAINEMLAALRKHLPPLWAQIMIDHYVEGRTLRDIADEIGRSRQWVRLLRNRALERMRRAYGVDLSGDSPPICIRRRRSGKMPRIANRGRQILRADTPH